MPRMESRRIGNTWGMESSRMDNTWGTEISRMGICLGNGEYQNG